MAEPETKQAACGANQALGDMQRQRQKAIWWGVFIGLAVCLVTALFNPSLALLAGGAVVILVLYAVIVSRVTRWIGRRIGG